MKVVAKLSVILFRCRKRRLVASDGRIFCQVLCTFDAILSQVVGFPLETVTLHEDDMTERKHLRRHENISVFFFVEEDKEFS